jgi:hypothetical protein
MRVFSEDNKPSLDELLHYGVKGMKWGVRKQTIVAARQRQAQRHRELVRYDDQAQTAPNAKAAKAAENKARKIAVDLQTNDDRITAAHMTRGEQVASVLVAGPVGAAIVVGNKIHVKSVVKETERNRELAKEQGF